MSFIFVNFFYILSFTLIENYTIIKIAIVPIHQIHTNLWLEFKIKDMYYHYYEYYHICSYLKNISFQHIINISIKYISILVETAIYIHLVSLITIFLQ
jgi:hypothetical protein